VRGLGVTFLVRRARSSWLLLSCVVVTILLATGLAAAGWSFAAGVVPSGAQSSLANPQGRTVAVNGLVDAGLAASDGKVIQSALHAAWPGVGFQVQSALWADPIQLPPTITIARPKIGEIEVTSETQVQIQVGALDGISAQATLTAGKWPGPPGRGGPVPVAFPAPVASQLHLKVGSTLTGVYQSGGERATLLVTGLFLARNPASTYWSLDLEPVTGSASRGFSTNVGFSNSYAGLSSIGSVITYGPAVVNPAAFGGALTVHQASWLALPQAAAMARGNISALAASTSAALAQVATVLPDGLQVTSSLPQLLAGIASTVVLTRSLFTIAELLLLLVAGAGLALAARLLASLREEESALLRARGATRWQLVRPALAEAVVLGAVAAVAGVLVGTRLTGVLAGLGNVRLEDYSGIPALAWLSALAMVILCAAVMTWPALRALSPDVARARRGRQARLAGIAWAGGDLALVALAAVAVWQLRDYSAVAHPSAGSLGIDPVVAIAPALALAGIALIPLRALPMLARLADKATDRARRLAAAMVSWQIARRPIRQAGPVLLVVITTATTTLALASYASWHQSAADQAAFTVGADVRVDAAGPLPLGAASAITRAPGVSAATDAALATAAPVGTASTGGGPSATATAAGAGTESQVIALDARTADKTILLRPDLSPLPLSALWQRITPTRLPGLALPGQADRLEILASLAATTRGGAAEAQRDIGSVQVTATVQDATGATYQVPAGEPLPFDGRPHSLVFTLSGPGQASYPLRLTGLSLGPYVLPPYDTANPSSSPVAGLTIESLAASGTASGPFGAPFAGGSALKAWKGVGSSPYVPTGPPNLSGGPPPPSDGVPPAVTGWRGTAGGGQRLTFSTGNAPSLAVLLGVNLAPGIATGEVSITAPAPSTVPAIATSGYLTANKLGVGSVTAVSVDGSTVPIKIVASVTHFPTVTGQSQALIVDLGTINDLLAVGQVSLPVTRWWLSTENGEVPSLPASLGLSVTSRVAQQAALLGNALLTAPRQAMLAIGAAAVLLGVLGFSISVAASLRSRRTQSAVFAALGVGKRAQAAQLCLEQCALSLPAATAGLLAGIGLAQLLVPAITLTTNATAPVPSALVVVPLGWAAALALLTAAVPVAAAALSVLRRPDPAARLRAEAI